MSASRLEGLGGLDDEFIVEISFSQNVTGFFLSDLDFANASARNFSGTGRSYSVVVTPDQDLEGFVSVAVPDGAAVNSAGERSQAQTLRFRVDTRPPMYVRSYVDGSRLSMLYDEELDEGQTPPATSFDVFVNGRREDPAEIDVDRHEVVLTLRAPVLAIDTVRVRYVAGIRPLQDATENAVAPLAVTDVVNRTGQTVVPRAPGAPRALAASATGTSSIRLAWRVPIDEGSSPVTAYRVETSSNGGSTWSALASRVGAGAATYTHRGLAPGTKRHYRVAAINDAGTGPFSNVAQATTAAAAPGAPRSLTAAPGGPSGRDRIVLSWNAPSSNGGRAITGYRVQARAGGLAWVTLAANTGSTATSYTHAGLSPGTTRTYRVAAINSIGVGALSNTATATTRTAPPGAPRDVRARATGSSSIAVSWLPPSANGGSQVTGYRIEGRPGSGSWRVLVRSTGPNATRWEHTGLAPATTWIYRVGAINAAGVGTTSSEARATTETGVPGPPAGLAATTVGSSQINLSWSRPSKNGGATIVGYRIEVSADGGSAWTDLRSNTGSTATTFSHRGLAANSTRHYRVSARNARGAGPASNVARATTEADVPGPPGNLTARAAGQTRIDLAWSAPGTDGGAPIIGYRIEVSADGGSVWSDLRNNTGSTATNFTHRALSPNSTRLYRVSARNAKGAGPASNVAQATTDATAPGAPASLSALAIGASRINLAWSPPSDDGGAEVSGYRIEGRHILGAWRILVRNTGTAGTVWQHTGLTPVTTWVYRISAINAAGVGARSSEARATTEADVPGPPTRLAARAVGTSQINLAWSAPENDGGARITGYRIEVSSDEGSTWTTLRSNTGSTATTFSHRGLTANSTRHYRVSARNARGTGAASNVARATTDAEAPSAPLNPWAGSRGPSRIDVTWRAPASDGGAAVTGYRIEASDNGGGSWNTLVANTRTTATSWSDTGLAPATTRHYRISAINAAGVGEASAVVSATTDAVVPNAPTGLSATAVAPDQIDLAWNAPGYDGGAPITGYRVEVSETGGAWRDLVANTRTPATTHSHTGLQPGSVRFYRVSAINLAGAGRSSGVASAITDDPVERAGRLNASALPRIAATMASSTLSAIAGRVDAVATDRGMSRRMDMGGLSSMAAMAASPGGGALAQRAAGGGPGAGPASLLGGSSFVLPVGGEAAQLADGLSLAAWGAGEYSGMSRTGADALDWSGGLASVHVGADVRLASDVIAGVAASRSWGSFDFTDRVGAQAVEGSYGTTMTGVTPYAAWFPGRSGNAVWGAGGVAFGEVDVEDEREAIRSSPATMMTGAAGAAYQVLGTGIGGLRVRADGWAGRVTVDGTAQVERAVLDLVRARLAMEWSQGHRTASGLEIGLRLEGGARLDAGDGANGVGAEVGGGLRFANVNAGITAEGRGRLFVSGSGEYEEWGVGGVLRFDPPNRTGGLSLRLAPTYGNAASGVNGLWERGGEAWEGMSGHGAATAPGAVDGEVAWSRRGAGGSPYGAFRVARQRGRLFASGVRYDIGVGMGVSVEVTRREGLPGGAAHAVGVRGRLKFQ